MVGLPGSGKSTYCSGVSPTSGPTAGATRVVLRRLAPGGWYAFDAANTVLVDNHLEKFERNPLGTCVLVETWTADRSDDAAKASVM